jgi:gas vesicle protein
MYDRDDSAPSLLSFLIGGIVGASLTCLLAPQSGIALRRRIRAGVAGGTRRGRTAARRLADAAGVRIQDSSARVPEPGLPTDMGGSGRG